MSATVTTPTTATTPSDESRRTHPLRRATLIAGLAAAAVTAAFAAITHAAGVSFAVDGETMTPDGFALFTFVAAIVGGMMVAGLNRAGHQARRRFVITATVLTVVSCIPSISMPDDTASKVAFVASHLIAAAVIVPLLARHAHR